MVDVTYNLVTSYFKEIQNQHIDLNSFFRFNRSEIMGPMRSGVDYYALLLEDIDLDINDNGAQNKSNDFELAILILDHAPKENYDKQQIVLHESLEIAREIERRITADSEKPDHWLYNRYDANETSITKVGPIFNDPCYGYRLATTLTAINVKRLPNPDKWNDLS